MNITEAKVADLLCVGSLLNKVTKNLHENGIQQWEYPWDTIRIEKQLIQSITIGVRAVVLNDKNEILLALRWKDPEANKWSIPGGKVELFETLEAATIREVKEEVNLDIEIDKLLCTAETIEKSTCEH